MPFIVVPYQSRRESKAARAFSSVDLGIYKVALTHKKLGITKEMLSNKILPFLFPLAIENGLNLNQVGVLQSTA